MKFYRKMGCVLLVTTMTWLLPAVSTRGDQGQPPAVTSTVTKPATGVEPKELKKMSLEELMEVQVSTISRVDERVDEAPGSVYVFTREIIQKRGYRSLGELLQVVPGFTVLHRDLQFVAGVRGLNANDNEKITLLVNGVNMNNVNEPDFLNGPINLDNVERVEVVVGPSSLFQPANTLAATVNVITKNVQGTEAVLATGSDLPYSATLMTGKQWAPDKYFSVSFTTEKVEGFDAWNALNRPGLAGQKETGELYWPNYFGVLKGQYGEVSGQFVAYRSSMPELNINNGSPTNDGRYVDQFYSLSLQDEHVWSSDLTSILIGQISDKEQTRLNDGGMPENAVEVANKQRVYFVEAGLRYTGFQQHLIQAGVQSSYDENYDSYFTFNVTSPPEHFPKTPLVVGNSSAVGFYADDEYRVNHWLKLVGGMRVDYNNRLDGERWFPGGRFAIILEPVTNWVSKLIYNHVARMPAPWATQLNKAWGSDIPNSPSFATVSTTATEPETLSTYQWENIFYAGRTRLSAIVYHQELENFISWFEPHTNVGNFRGNGVELSAQAPLKDWFTVWANFAWNDSVLHPFIPPNFTINTIEQHVTINPDGRIIGAAAYTANVGCDWELLPNLTFSPTVRYFTEQAAWENTSPTTGHYTTIRNRFYLDASLVWRNWQNIKGVVMDIRLSGYNLTDNRQPVAGQWLRDTYQPRGISGVLAVDLRF
jgi:outer membrane receptor protein involved in Fe transport